jgi:hypothetical protein
VYTYNATRQLYEPGGRGRVIERRTVPKLDVTSVRIVWSVDADIPGGMEICRSHLFDIVTKRTA